MVQSINTFAFNRTVDMLDQSNWQEYLRYLFNRQILTTKEFNILITAPSMISGSVMIVCNRLFLERRDDAAVADMLKILYIISCSIASLNKPALIYPTYPELHAVFIARYGELSREDHALYFHYFCHVRVLLAVTPFKNNKTRLGEAAVLLLCNPDVHFMRGGNLPKRAANLARIMTMEADSHLPLELAPPAAAVAF
jgi:hypothetical protein